MDLQSLTIDRRGSKAQRRGPRSPWPFRLIALAAVGVAGWLFWPLVADLVDRVRLPEVRLFAVTETSAATAAAATGTAANGHIVATRRAALSSDVPGRIVELRVQEGVLVQQGDVVARLFADEYQAALRHAQVGVQAAEAARARATAQIATVRAEAEAAVADAATATAQLAEAAAQLDWATRELERQQSLTAGQISSPRELERARSDHAAAEARVEALTAAQRSAAANAATSAQRILVAEKDEAVARAQVDVAAAAVAQAEATLSKTDVRAPFTGIVVLKDAEVGEVVSPNVQGGSNARGAVCTLVDFESLEVQANVPETSVGGVEVGASADVYLDAFAEQRLAGTVDRIWPTADRQKATIEVRIRLAQRDPRMRPDMGVRVVFQRKDQPATTAAPTDARRILVPEAAIVTIDGRPGAFVFDRDRVAFAAVATSERKNGRVAIDSGLRPGQRIVLDPPGSLQDGDRVRIRKEP